MIKLLLTILLFLSIIVFAFAFSTLIFPTKSTKKTIIVEGFEDTSGHTIILMGDSILKNDYYVGKDKSVEYFLREKLLSQNGRTKLLNYAVDGATINDVYGQINMLSNDLNSDKTILFLSVGGNNIMDEFVLGNSKNKKMVLEKLAKKYEMLVGTLREKMGNIHIFLLNLYYPLDKKLDGIRQDIQWWNSSLEDDDGLASGFVKLSNIIGGSTDDFTLDKSSSYKIEPSAVGGEKIASELYSVITRNV